MHKLNKYKNEKCDIIAYETTLHKKSCFGNGFYGDWEILMINKYAVVF